MEVAYQPLEIGKKTPPSEFEVSPPAVAIPGMTGDMPFKVGQVINPKHLTETERKSLESAGWKAGDPIPANLAKHLTDEVDKVVRDATENLVPPVPIDTPPMHIPDAVEVSDLPPQRQAELRAAIEQAKEFEKQLQDGTPTLSSLPAFQNTKTIEIELENDLDKPTVPPTASPAGNQTGIGSLPPMHMECPQCGWDSNVPVIPEPDEATKNWYLQAQLGTIPFERTVDLLRGEVQVTFRELSPGELDKIYQNVKQALDMNTSSVADFTEAITRRRLVKQLARIKIGDQGHSIPTGDEYSMEELMDAVLGKVLTNLSIYRLVRAELNKFNRLVAKLEALVLSGNF